MHTRFLLLLTSAVHLAIGLHELLTEEPFPHKASAWQVLFLYGFPELLWDLAFIVVGFLALFGLIYARCGRLSFRVSSVLFVLWAASSAWSWQRELGATMYATIALGYLALLQWGIAEAWFSNQQIAARVAQLARPSE